MTKYNYIPLYLCLEGIEGFNFLYNTLIMINITINGTDYKVKYTIRALFIFEQITGRAFEIKTTMDNYLFFYSMILANNPDNPLDWDEFIDAVDNDTNLINQLNKVIMDSQKKNELFESISEGNGEKKS